VVFLAVVGDYADTNTKMWTAGILVEKDNRLAEERG
jgi:hypothetical protein